MSSTLAHYLQDTVSAGIVNMKMYFFFLLVMAKSKLKEILAALK